MTGRFPERKAHFAFPSGRLLPLTFLDIYDKITPAKFDEVAPCQSALDENGAFPSNDDAVHARRWLGLRLHKLPCSLRLLKGRCLRNHQGVRRRGSFRQGSQTGIPIRFFTGGKEPWQNPRAYAFFRRFSRFLCCSVASD